MSYISKFFKSILAKIRSSAPYLIILTLLLAITLIFMWPRIVIVVKSGEAGVLYLLFFGGTITDYVYPEGIYFILPWDEMTIYDARIHLITHEFDVLTNKGLPIHLKIAIRFQPEYELIGVLHQKVGPDYIEKVIIPQVESVLRRNIGRHNPEDIYTNKEGVLTSIITLALEEAGRKYVRMTDIIIRSLSLPPTIQSAIEQKLVEEQVYQAYDFKLLSEKQEAIRKGIEAQGIRDYQGTVSQTLTEDLIRWQGIQATLDLSKSNNSKVVVIGAGEQGLPIILGGNN